MVDRVCETYEGLWGELMFVMHDPDVLWRVNEGRADWFETIHTADSGRVLDLGCGNGYLDVILGRRNRGVVGVDQVGTVVEVARRLLQDEPVEFIESDLRTIDFDEKSFDVVVMFGVTGLMSLDDDRKLLADCARWLDDEGFLLLDCDIGLADTETITVEHRLGTINWNWTSDPEARTNKLTSELQRPDGVIVGLRDPIDPTRRTHEGLHRYIYPQEQLTDILTSVGFSVEQVPHYTEHVFHDQPPTSYMLKARTLNRHTRSWQLSPAAITTSVEVVTLRVRRRLQLLAPFLRLFGRRG